MSDTSPEHLPSSALGTKAYWDSLYTNEVQNHAANPSDRGTVWFDDSDAEAKILSYLATKDLPHDTTTFLDLGCGNGSLLFALRDAGADSSDSDDDQEQDEGADAPKESWTGRMLGVDYSPQSIELATSIQASRPSDPYLEFQTWDILSGSLSEVLKEPQSQTGWDVVLDKGTFDAISLSSEKDSQGRRLNEGYRERVLGLVREGGFFVITSCNWTEPELRKWFEDQEGFALDGRVEYRTFSFGGVKGQPITTLCFKRID
ncbi:S-adenosyl-L-methionine-dependent methyltransferase [Emericellopsis atlantica]|uniref:Protein-lysine N-methyltransferase EFM4 n=1 Tax=Emericellopsis atlantica TaxID=2614577 RepID=A0A9P7ZLL1_9HYPO|nr:S-adenosyl-L-methionine-dependent methyltransferase [Emericellopsis atlantica]KAG9253957.1 S-adenosyl-L-methionine-dependent methyltransferase [Emericellopsis atlantica]